MVWQNTVNQLILDLLVQPAEIQSLPTALADGVHVKHHQMRVLLQEQLEMER